ncbi:uncharacterized protein LOC135111300 [Scylla paramamosain]|uniref:uncharacterized protein LOC135111300 n=1 Tax=Scylla paramamosain TaxID=85552 RepID=UPI0030828A7E
MNIVAFIDASDTDTALPGTAQHESRLGSHTVPNLTWESNHNLLCNLRVDTERHKRIYGTVLSCVVAALGVVMHDMRASVLVYDNNLVLQMVSRVSSGNYTCAATNTLTATFEEFIEPAPPRSQEATLAGRRSPATLHAASSPLPPPLPRFPFLPSYLRSSQLYISSDSFKNKEEKHLYKIWVIV